PDPFHGLLLCVGLQSLGKLQSRLGAPDTVCTYSGESWRGVHCLGSTFSMACRRGLLTATISNRQRTIRSSASQTIKLDMCSIAGPTTTAAWASHSMVSYRLISMCQQT